MQVRVCKNPAIQNYYLDQIDQRNKIEKTQFRDVFTDYMALMEDYGIVQDRMKKMEFENYQLRQNNMNSSISALDHTNTSVIGGG